MKLTNVHGQTVNLTPAQLREYKKVQDEGTVLVRRRDRKFRIYKLLQDNMLITVKWAYPESVKFERW